MRASRSAIIALCCLPAIACSRSDAPALRRRQDPAPASLAIAAEAHRHHSCTIATSSSRIALTIGAAHKSAGRCPPARPNSVPARDSFGPISQGYREELGPSCSMTAMQAVTRLASRTRPAIDRRQSPRSSLDRPPGIADARSSLGSGNMPAMDESSLSATRAGHGLLCVGFGKVGEQRPGRIHVSFPFTEVVHAAVSDQRSAHRRPRHAGVWTDRHAAFSSDACQGAGAAAGARCNGHHRRSDGPRHRRGIRGAARIAGSAGGAHACLPGRRQSRRSRLAARSVSGDDTSPARMASSSTSSTSSRCGW